MDKPPLRILTSCSIWQGAADYGLLRALRRAGHSVTNLPDSDFIPNWRTPWLRAARRLLRPVLAAEYRRALLQAARELKPDVFLAYKGTYVDAEAVAAIGRSGAVTLAILPDVSFTIHGPIIPRALPVFDWVFTTKSFGPGDLAREIGVTRASFLPHCFDPETHHPVTLDARDAQLYACHAAFIGAWSPKKEALLTLARPRLAGLDVKIWGARWEQASKALAPLIMKRPVFGQEYAKAVTGAKINIALLTEAMGEASSGDLTTTRTFEIPAIGGFMLHERNAEAQALFAEGAECAMFSSGEDLAEKILYYLAHDEERRRIAAAGRARCLDSGYSADARIASILHKARELMRSRRAKDDAS